MRYSLCLSDTVADLAGLLVEHLEPGWNIPPRDADTREVINEVKRHLPYCVHTDPHSDRPVSEMVCPGSGRCGPGTADGRGHSHHRMLYSVLSSQWSLWGKVENIPQEESEHQVFYMYQLLSGYDRYDTVSGIYGITAVCIKKWFSVFFTVLEQFLAWPR